LNRLGRRGLLLALLLAGLLVAPPAAQAAGASKTQYYVSLGDSYAVGYQPGRGSTSEGFADQTVTKARMRGYRLKLVNFGCGGATTVSIIKRNGCPKPARAVGGAPYNDVTQATAAARFLRSHRGEVALVTVSIGGNDVTQCARAAGDPVACVADAVGGINENLRVLVRRLRRAAGPKVRIVGTTYPDVILGQWVHPPVNQDLARLSVVAFQALINPALKKQYESVGGRFADVTKATGAYGSLDRLTNLPPYGDIPVPVAKVCRLTWYCEKGDIHARKSGYGVIAGLIAKTLPRRA
jgi:lysophospholipase L1-like esterase